MDHDQAAQGSLNISDVIEVLQTTDPEFVDVSSNMYGGGPAGLAAGNNNNNNNAANAEDLAKRSAYVKIVEQPASKALRFRYECEGRSAGSIPGVNSSPENRTFPSIQVVGYHGRAVVVVSCVTKDQPYRPHPHNLVSRESCKKGVCTMELNNENMAVTFPNLGIQCVKKKDIEESLRIRKEIRVDPYQTGYAHSTQPTSIDLNAVRLCFQVFLEGSKRGIFNFMLSPVVSEPIYDKKAMSDLVICKLSDCSCSVAGGKEVILLCEKVAKEDIKVRFYEERSGQVVWEGFGDFQPTQVHKQVAISFRTPSYSSLKVENPVRANIQLLRPSDGATSESLPFEFLPLDSDPVILKRKRQKFSSEPRQFQDSDNVVRLHPPAVGYGMSPMSPDLSQAAAAAMLQVKREPTDTSYLMYGSHRRVNATPSPQPQASPASVGRTPSPMDYMSHVTFQAGNVYDYQLHNPLSGVTNSLQPEEAALPEVSPPHMVHCGNSLNLATNVPPPDLTNADQNMPEINSIFYDLDAQTFRSIQLDSTDFANLLCDTNLSDNFSSNLTLSESRLDTPKEFEG